MKTSRLPIDLKSFAVLALCLLSALAFLSCEDSSTTTTPPDPFSLEVAVKLPDGSPAAGMQVSAWNKITLQFAPAATGNGWPAFAGGTPTASVRFVVPVQSSVRMDLVDINGDLLKNLVDEVRAAGVHTVAFYADDLPNGVYRYHLTARDLQSNDILFDDEKTMVVSVEDVTAQIIGTTDAEGIVKIDDDTRLPGYRNLPDFPLVDATGSVVGSFSILDVATIRVAEPASGCMTTLDKAILDESNRISMVYDPATASCPQPPVPAPLIGTRSVTVVTDTGDDPPAFQWALGQNWPNPVY